MVPVMPIASQFGTIFEVKLVPSAMLYVSKHDGSSIMFVDSWLFVHTIILSIFIEMYCRIHWFGMPQ